MNESDTVPEGKGGENRLAKTGFLLSVFLRFFFALVRPALGPRLM
jgi:hypothetical protein